MLPTLYAASPRPLVTNTDNLGAAVVFDSNLITSFRAALQTRDSELGRLLRAIQGELSVGTFVVLLPAISETYYRRKGSSLSSIVERKTEWFQEHFTPFGVGELIQVGLPDDSSPAAGLREILGRVSLHYWALRAAQRAHRRFPRTEQRAAALDAFFDDVQRAGADGAGSNFYLLTIGSALCGSDDAMKALNVADDSAAALMNGSWDLYFWHAVVQLWLASPKTLLHPTLFTSDKSAAGIFNRLVATDPDTLSFTFGSNNQPLDDRAVQQLAVRLQGMSRGSSANVDWLCRAQRLVPTEDRCPEFEALLAHLKQLCI